MINKNNLVLGIHRSSKGYSIENCKKRLQCTETRVI
jgi:hypothetical protein